MPESADGPRPTYKKRRSMFAFGGRSQPVDATRGQLAINNDDALPNARPNAFSESLRNQVSHNVIFSAALVPPRNHRLIGRRLPLITPQSPMLIANHISRKKPPALPCSDWHGGWIVTEQAEVVGASPRTEMLKIGALQRVRAFSRLDLHSIGTVLARPFVTQQRVLWRGGLCKASSEHHPIFDRHDRALAKIKGK